MLELLSIQKGQGHSALVPFQAGKQAMNRVPQHIPSFMSSCKRRLKALMHAAPDGPFCRHVLLYKDTASGHIYTVHC